MSDSQALLRWASVTVGLRTVVVLLLLLLLLLLVVSSGERDNSRLGCAVAAAASELALPEAPGRTVVQGSSAYWSACARSSPLGARRRPGPAGVSPGGRPRRRQRAGLAGHPGCGTLNCMHVDAVAAVAPGDHVFPLISALKPCISLNQCLKVMHCTRAKRRVQSIGVSSVDLQERCRHPRRPSARRSSSRQTPETKFPVPSYSGPTSAGHSSTNLAITLLTQLLQLLLPKSLRSVPHGPS